MGSARDISPDANQPGSPTRPPALTHPYPSRALRGSVTPPAGCQGGGCHDRDRQACHLPPPAPLLRHPPLGGGVRYPDHTGVARAPRHSARHDLHPSPESRREGCAQPGRHVAMPRFQWGAYAGPHKTLCENDITKQRPRKFATCGRKVSLLKWVLC